MDERRGKEGVQKEESREKAKAERVGPGLFKVTLEEEVKCGGCNYWTNILFIAAKSEEDAIAEAEDPERELGCCEDCNDEMQ